MSTHTPNHIRTTIDGLAQLGSTRHDLMGIRYDEPAGGNTPAEPAPKPTPPSAEPTPSAAWDGKIESLPADAQRIITDLRNENATRRVALTTAETRTAAILKAAGIETGEPDPVKAAEAAATKAAESEAKATDALRKLAIFQSALEVGADASKLLDRTSFTASVTGLDPADGAAIKAAIDAALKADPTLKQARAAGASAVENSGGTGETGVITEEQLAQMTPEQISTAFDEGKLAHLL